MGRLRRWRRADEAHSGYRAELVHLLWEFVSEAYPGRALPEDEFTELVLRYQDAGAIRSANRYLGDLWRLFVPDYQERLDEYYVSFGLHCTMTALSYATDPVLIEEHYVRPYRIARERLGSFSVLEIGPALPHGFLVSALEDSAFCTSLTENELDMPYTRFVEWFCGKRGIPFALVPAVAGRASRLPRGSFDFVVAKDVFEHLMDPDVLLDEIAEVASERALLALDLADKGARIYQHVSPQLAHLRERIARLGFEREAEVAHLTLYRRSGMRG